MDLLMEWLRFDTATSLFPREFGRYRFVVKDFDEFLKAYNENLNSDDCWSSVYSLDQIYEHKFDTIFLDFDFGAVLKEEKDGLAELEEFVGRMRDKFPRVRLYFSGAKGFHVYLDFGKEVELLRFKVTVRQFIEKEMEGFERLAKALDRHVLGNMRAMARVVGSVRYTTDGRRTMMRLDETMKWDDWLFMIEEGISANPNGEIRTDKVSGVEEITKLDEKNRESSVEWIMKNKEPPEELVEKVKRKPVPPCVLRCYELITQTGELKHEGRLLLALWMIYAGATDDEIVEVFSKANDFKRQYTLYQINHLRSRKYLLYKCKNIMSFGLCPYKCELYPWVMKDD